MALLPIIPAGITCTDWESGSAPAPEDMGQCTMCGDFGDLFVSGDGLVCKACSADPACRYFVRGEGHGSCKVAKRFMCEEWLKVHNSSSPAPTAPAIPAVPNGAPSRSGGNAPQTSVQASGGTSATPQDHGRASGLAGALRDANVEPMRKDLTGAYMVHDPKMGEAKALAKPKAEDKPKGRRYQPMSRPDAQEPAAQDGAPLEASAREIDPRWVRELGKTGVEATVKIGDASVTLLGRRTGQDRLELTYREAAALSMIMSAFPGSNLVALTKGDSIAVDDEDDFEET